MESTNVFNSLQIVSDGSSARLESKATVAESEAVHIFTSSLGRQRRHSEYARNRVVQIVIMFIVLTPDFNILENLSPLSTATNRSVSC